MMNRFQTLLVIPTCAATARVAKYRAMSTAVKQIKVCERAEARLKSDVEAHGAQLAEWCGPVFGHYDPVFE